jgi:AP-1 complex subunit gamma-1
LGVGLTIQAGNYVREEILSSFIRLVCHTPELQFYTAQRLYTALSSDLSQESLTLAAVWIIGEFADVLLQGGTIDDGEELKQVSSASNATADVR